MRKLPTGLIARPMAPWQQPYLCSCAVGPNYQRPVTPVEPQFVNVGQPGFNGADVEARFWTVFNDPKLNHLVDDALKENKDLKRARANLKASRAARRLAGFDLFPTVTRRGRLHQDSRKPQPAARHHQSGPHAG